MILMCSLSDRTVIEGVFSLTTRSAIGICSDRNRCSFLGDGFKTFTVNRSGIRHMPVIFPAMRKASSLVSCGHVRLTGAPLPVL
jgi:hypothetical protein